MSESPSPDFKLSVEPSSGGLQYWRGFLRRNGYYFSNIDGIKLIVISESDFLNGKKNCRLCIAVGAFL